MTEDDSDNQSTRDSSQSDSIEIVVSGSGLFLFDYADDNSDSATTEETTDMEEDPEAMIPFPSNTVACSSCRTGSLSIRKNQRETKTASFHDSRERKGRWE